jgi:hypothetical protein
MFLLSIRALPARLALFSKPTVLQTASYVITRRSREVANSHDFTRNDEDTPVAANNTRSGMDEITNILDNVDISGLPLSSNFSSELPHVSTPPLIFLRHVHSYCKI